MQTKIQLINGSWHFFYGARMLDLRVSREMMAQDEVEEKCKERICEFVKECEERQAWKVKPNFTY